MVINYGKRRAYEYIEAPFTIVDSVYGSVHTRATKGLEAEGGIFENLMAN